MNNRQESSDKRSQAARGPHGVYDPPSQTPESRQRSESLIAEAPVIALPKGGGAIKDISEKFSVNAANGTASFSIPLPTSEARGFSPALWLAYNSGSGNGPFGLGFSVTVSSIKRKTEKELPQYRDESDVDTFILSDAEDLVPEFKKDNAGIFLKDADGLYVLNEFDRNFFGVDYSVRCYRPRVERAFSRIERWTEKNTGYIHWRTISRDNIVSLFGSSKEARIADPRDDRRIFQWFLDFAFDDKGNCVYYEYKPEDDKGLDLSLLHNKNRKNPNLTYSNAYLKRVLYGVRTPYTNKGEVFSKNKADYLFETVFDYGEHDPLNPPFDETGDWGYRSDAFSSYRAGFEIRTSRLCKRVLHYHHFAELTGGSALVKSLDFVYGVNVPSGFTFLQEVVIHGYIKRADGTYTHQSMPPFSFGYQQHEWNREVRTLSPEDLVGAPAGLAQRGYLLVDLFSEGLAGILCEQDPGLFYKSNLGGGRFTRPQLIAPKPSFTGFGRQLQLLELEADGVKQLVQLRDDPKGFFEISLEEEWKPFRPFAALPRIDLNDSNTRMVDLSGDGMPDLLITEQDVISWYPSRGKEGFAPRRRVFQSFDEEKRPVVVFADGTETLFLADMKGDGLTDLVRIRNCEVCYWPNLGYGQFGAKVTMDHAPVFDFEGNFNPSLVKLADLDGSGTTDIIYIGRGKVSLYLNQQGNRLSDEITVEPFPHIDNAVQIEVADILGTALPCIVWSSPLPHEHCGRLSYVDLMNSRKPHLLISYKNNMGKEVSLEYKPSSHFYLEDKLAGRPWVTKLHFPVHCVSKSEIHERVTGARFLSSYKYHHGFYDHTEREFRGFGMVEQTDSERFEHWAKGNASNVVDDTLHQPPVLIKSWFHTGAFFESRRLLDGFAHEYWFEEMQRQGFPVTSTETQLPPATLEPAAGIDPSVMDELTVDDWREASRACRSAGLRSETFALDAPVVGATPDQLRKQLTPYVVGSHNCVVELLQPRGQNKYGVFLSRESEAVVYTYERATADPRVAHTLNVRVDEYGNVLESASVVYPRQIPDAGLPIETQQAQNTAYITYNENRLTNDVTGPDVLRLRMPAEAKTYELKGVTRSGALYTPADFHNILTGSGEVQYHELNVNPAPGTSQKRLIEHVRSFYYRNDLTGPLPLYQLQSRAHPFENHRLAYTPQLLNDIFAARATDAVMTEGKFVHSEGDLSWWIKSGNAQYIEGAETEADARNRFYHPVSYTDPFEAKTKVKYFSNYFLLVEETDDAVQNKTTVLAFDFRNLLARRVRDANDNVSEVLTDELGRVKVEAVFGKGGEADDLSGQTEFTTPVEETLVNGFLNAASSTQLTTFGKGLLQNASKRYVYDVHRYRLSSGKEPVSSSSIARERHFADLADSPVQISFEYTNGLGLVVMKKVQAEPGPAKHLVLNPDDTYTVSVVDTSLSVPEELRWVGNGRTVLSNKGKPVKQYEPYFSTTHRYESQKEIVESGVTPLLYYDPLGRMFRMVAPDTTFSRVEFDAWKQTVYDQNDTVLQSPWYVKRFNRLIDAELTAVGKDPMKEKQAAEKAALHADTPSSQHFDSLARPVLLVEHNGKDAFNNDILYFSQTELDIEGNMRSVTDDRGNTPIRHKYDMLGHMVYQQSMDGGQRWLLQNIAGDALRAWDERNHELIVEYDILHRPMAKTVRGGDGPAPLDHTFETVVYGEGLPLDKANNLRTNVVTTYDTAGRLQTARFDFKGNPLNTSRRFAQRYKEVPDWGVPNPDAALEAETFDSVFEYDALNRITRQTAPDGSIFLPAYNQAALLHALRITQGASTEWFVKSIDYNEKMQRQRVVYGNDVSTRYDYDRESFRLNRIESKRLNNDPLQDLCYTFDPVGNITHVEDKDIPVVFFDNTKITGTSTYTYDPLYRLIEATGREHTATVGFGSEDNWDDLPFLRQYSQGDPLSWRNYTQQYRYDGVANLSQVRHSAVGGSWIRDYNYAANSNRLDSTRVGGTTYNYTHHAAHGFITSLPHLQVMRWNFRDELQASARQVVLAGTPETTYYVYDSEGRRVRKVTENQAAAGVVDPPKKSQRFYVGVCEFYRKYDGAGAVTLERQTCNVSDDLGVFARVERRTQGDDGTPARLVRFQLGNHLGSACIETDGAARVISYEEYHPFGTTSYQAMDRDIRAANKRYRYTSMERDEESGLEYHAARYYLPWLGRWLSPDSAGIHDGLNVYAYVRGNPLSLHDPSGKQGAAPPRTSAQMISQQRGAAPDLANELTTTPQHETPLDLSPYNRRPSGSTILDDIMQAFDAVSRWIRNFLPGIIAAPLAGIVEILSGLVQLIGSLFAWNSRAAVRGLAEMGLGVLRIVGFREVVEDTWIPGAGTGLPTGLSLPESLARDLAITRRRTDQITDSTAARNGMHAWHASTNAILAGRVGPIGAPFLFIAGLVHESPIDWESFQGEQEWQGTVNHILDSFMDIIANIFGILIGLLIPRRWSVYVAALLGNQIPGPGDPDPAFGGAGHRYHEGPGANDPRRAWGHYPPPIGRPNAPAAPPGGP